MTEFDDRKPIKRIMQTYQQEISSHIDTLFPTGFLDPTPIPAVEDILLRPDKGFEAGTSHQSSEIGQGIGSH